MNEVVLSMERSSTLRAAIHLIYNYICGKSMIDNHSKESLFNGYIRDEED